MKSLLTSALLSSTLLLNSCTTTVLASKDSDELARKLQNGKTYTFIKDDGSRSKFTVQRIDATTVAGTNFEGKVIEIPRNQIGEIKKSNTLGTVLIAAGVLAAIVVIPAYVSNKPVGQ